eukprot:gb/GECG01005502.1/.p2 GENE.gb/GECG01005502.1/~~gb/GECG01005502.1/.p2  ORF type:complete len:240 (-),score=29.41 gb/GECG01005502.1/:231-950(-)
MSSPPKKRSRRPKRYRSYSRGQEKLLRGGLDVCPDQRYRGFSKSSRSTHLFFSDDKDDTTEIGETVTPSETIFTTGGENSEVSAGESQRLSDRKKFPSATEVDIGNGREGNANANQEQTLVRRGRSNAEAGCKKKQKKGPIDIEKASPFSASVTKTRNPANANKGHSSSNPKTVEHSEGANSDKLGLIQRRQENGSPVTAAPPPTSTSSATLHSRGKGLLVTQDEKYEDTSEYRIEVDV